MAASLSTMKAGPAAPELEPGSSDHPAVAQLEAIQRAWAVISFSPDGHILEANDNFLAAMGYRAEEVIGRHHRMFMPPGESNTASYRRFWDDLRTGSAQPGEFHRVAAGGRDVWIRAAYCPIRDAHGAVTRVVKVAMDVTSDVRARRALQTESQELARLGERLTADAIQTARGAGQVRDASGSIHDEIASTSAGVEQMGASISEIARSTSQTSQLASEAARASSRIAGQMADLESGQSDVERVVRSIGTIAQQTRLLALNATMEAARAERRGAGFAVVAREVKELANATREASEHITRQVATLQEQTRSAAEAIRDVSRVIGTLDGLLVNIAGAVEEQSAVTRDMNERLARAHAAAGEVAQIAGSLAHHAGATQEGAESVSRAARRMSDPNRAP